MKNKKLMLKQSLKALSLCFILAHSLELAAAPQPTQAANTAQADASSAEYQQIIALLNDNKLSEAKAAANQILAGNDKAIRAYLVLADIANKEKDMKEMQRVLELGLEKARGSEVAEIEVFKVLGQVYAATKQADKILPIAENLVKHYPKNSTATNLLAQTYVISNDKTKAEKTLRGFIAQNPQDAPNRLLLAKLLMEQANKKAETLKLLDEAIKLMPNSTEGLATKVAYLINLKSYPDALALAEKIDTQFPDLTTGKVLKGEVYLAQKNLAAATEIYEKIFSIQPSDKALSTLATLLVAQKRIPDAIALLEKELLKKPKNVSLHFNIANLYMQTGDAKQAENHYKEMLNLDAENLYALNNLAVLYSQRNDVEAIALAKKAYTIAPNEPSIADTYGYTLVKLGDAKEGVAILEKTLLVAPKASDLQFHLAIGYAKTDNKKKAIELLEKLTKAEQTFAEKDDAVRLLGELKSN